MRSSNLLVLPSFPYAGKERRRGAVRSPGALERPASPTRTKKAPAGGSSAPTRRLAVWLEGARRDGRSAGRSKLPHRTCAPSAGRRLSGRPKSKKRPPGCPDPPIRCDPGGSRTSSSLDADRVRGRSPSPPLPGRGVRIRPGTARRAQPNQRVSGARRGYRDESRAHRAGDRRRPPRVHRERGGRGGRPGGPGRGPGCPGKLRDDALPLPPGLRRASPGPRRGGGRGDRRGPAGRRPEPPGGPGAAGGGDDPHGDAGHGRGRRGRGDPGHRGAGVPPGGAGPGVPGPHAGAPPGPAGGRGGGRRGQGLRPSPGGDPPLHSGRDARRPCRRGGERGGRAGGGTGLLLRSPGALPVLYGGAGAGPVPARRGDGPVASPAGGRFPGRDPNRRRPQGPHPHRRSRRGLRLSEGAGQPGHPQGRGHEGPAPGRGGGRRAPPEPGPASGGGGDGQRLRPSRRGDPGPRDPGGAAAPGLRRRGVRGPGGDHGGGVRGQDDPGGGASHHLPAPTRRVPRRIPTGR